MARLSTPHAHVRFHRRAFVATVAAALIGLASVAVPAPAALAAPAPPPDLPACLSTSPIAVGECFGFGGALGTVSGPVLHPVVIGTEVTMTTPDEDTTTPIQCGDLGCTYRSFNWIWDSFFDSGIQLVSGCGTNQTTCTIRYVGNGIGDAAEYWQPLFSQHWYGRIPNGGTAHAFYAPPKIYPVTVNTVGADGSQYRVEAGSVAFLVRSGANPNVADCLPSGWAQQYSQSATVPVPDCVIASAAGLSGGTAFGGFLPNDSGSWDIVAFNRQIGSLAGPVRLLAPEFSAPAVTPAGDDLVVEATFLRRPSLAVQVSPSDLSLGVGEAAEVTVTVSAVDGNAGSIDGVTFSRPTLFSNTAIGYSVVGSPSPVPPTEGFSLANGASRSFVVTLLGVAEGNEQTTATASGTTDQGIARSDSGFLTVHVVPTSTTTTIPSGSAPEPPVVTAASAGGPGSVSGTVEGEAGGLRTITIAASAAEPCLRQMSGSGVAVVGSTQVQLDAGGNASFQITGPVPAGWFVYGTALKGTESSAVGDCFAVAPAPTTTTTTTTTTAPGTTSSLPPTSTTTTTPASTTTVAGTTTTPGATTTTAPMTPALAVPPPPVASTGVPDPVGDLYRRLLSRNAEPAGKAGWLARLAAGATMESVARGIAGSTEHHRRLVDGEYERLLSRAPDAAGSAYWTVRLDRGMEPDHMRVLLVASPEAWANAGADPEQWISDTWNALVGRDPSDAELERALADLANGELGRRAVASRIYALIDDARRLQADIWYSRLLDRPATADERDAWASARAGGTAEVDLAAAVSLLAR